MMLRLIRKQAPGAALAPVPSIKALVLMSLRTFANSLLRGLHVHGDGVLVDAWLEGLLILAHRPGGTDDGDRNMGALPGDDRLSFLQHGAAFAFIQLDACVLDQLVELGVLVAGPAE